MHTRSSNKGARPGLPLSDSGLSSRTKKVVREPSVGDDSDNQGSAPITPLSFVPKRKASKSMGQPG